MWCERRIAWLAKNASSTDGSISANVTVAKTTIFAQSTGSRFGTAPSEARIIPVEYSPLITSTPSTPIASCERFDAGERDVERMAVEPLAEAHVAPAGGGDRRGEAAGARS